MSPVELWACLAADCTTIFYRTKDGRCPRCGAEGNRIFWVLKPPRASDA
jgi:rubrerythrin